MRLDKYLFTKNFFVSVTKAQQSVKRNEVIVNGSIINKPSFPVDELKEYRIELVKEKQYVSVGAFKLEKALNDFCFNVENFTCVDIGASTGGFTDCLITKGAKKVYAVDLNDDLLHESLKRNPKVIPVIKNARMLKENDFNNDEIDLIVADLSFISSTVVFPIFNSITSSKSKIILLIKPQFEMDKKIHLKNGIVKNKQLHLNSIKKIYFSAIQNRLYPENITVAPIHKEKNKEFLILLGREELNCKSLEYLNNIINNS